MMYKTARSDRIDVMTEAAPYPTWKDYLFATCRRTLAAAPVLGTAIEVIEEVHDRREAAGRHAELRDQMSRFERSVAATVRTELQTVLATLRKPNLSPTQLESEIHSLYAVRQQGYDAHLFEGLVRNSTFFDQLKARPSLFGTIVDDHALVRADAFYIFLDADKTRLLQVPPFALQQLLANQTRGVPDSAICGATDFFVRASDIKTPRAQGAGAIPPQFPSDRDASALEFATIAQLDIFWLLGALRRFVTMRPSDVTRHASLPRTWGKVVRAAKGYEFPVPPAYGLREVARSFASFYGWHGDTNLLDPLDLVLDYLHRQRAQGIQIEPRLRDEMIRLIHVAQQTVSTKEHGSWYTRYFQDHKAHEHRRYCERVSMQLNIELQD